MERRKVTFKLYPTSSQLKRLDGWVRLHAELRDWYQERTGLPACGANAALAHQNREEGK